MALTAEITDRNPDVSPLSLDTVIPRTWLRTLWPSDSDRYAKTVGVFLRDFPTLIGSQEEIIFILCYMDGNLKGTSPDFHSAIFLNAQAKIYRRESAPELVIHLMTLVCYVRTYCLITTCDPHYESYVNDFDAFLGHGYVDTMVTTLEKMLESVYRVIAAEDFASCDNRLAGFIVRMEIKHSLLRPNDMVSDLYWIDRMAHLENHNQAFSSLCQIIGYPDYTCCQGQLR